MNRYIIYSGWGVGGLLSVRYGYIGTIFVSPRCCSPCPHLNQKNQIEEELFEG